MLWAHTRFLFQQYFFPVQLETFTHTRVTFRSCSIMSIGLCYLYNNIHKKKLHEVFVRYSTFLRLETANQVRLFKAAQDSLIQIKTYNWL